MPRSQQAMQALEAGAGNRGTSVAYLTARIERDAPHILKAMKRGEYPSVLAAARAAGIVQERTPAQRVMALLRKLTERELADVRCEVERLQQVRTKGGT